MVLPADEKIAVILRTDHSFSTATDLFELPTMRRPRLHILLTWIVTCGLSLLGISQAGEFNEVLSIGDAAPVWKDLPGVDGKQHSLDDLAEKKVVVVVFTCNSCPAAMAYEDRLIAFANKHAADVGVVAINVNLIPADNLEQMQQRATSKKFPYPYLFDESQKIARDYGAVYTPEFYVLGPDRRIAYMGGFDNHSKAELATERYLEPAVEAVLKGTPAAKPETSAIGCRVRYARMKR
jgi:peroxiredoxin